MTLGEKVLKAVELGSDLFVEVDQLKYLPYRMMWGSSLQGHKRSSVQASLSRMVGKGYIKRIKRKDQVYLALTELGESWLQGRKGKVDLKLIQKNEKWDGYYRFIFFDIPEKDRAIRDVLRRALKSVRAVCWQKSVWVTTENVTRELSEFIDLNGLDDYCTLLEVKEIYNPKLLKMLRED